MKTKKIYLLMIALVAVTVFGAGCHNKDEMFYVTVTTNIAEPVTNKSFVSSFSSSTIGVYAINYYNVVLSSSTAIVSTGDNAVSPFPNIKVSVESTVYAWYPATAEELSYPDDCSTKAIKVVSTDDFAATSQTDYLWATPANVNKNNKTADLNFNHALSKVIFNIKKDETYIGECKLTEISFTSTGTPFLSGSGTMAIANGTISGLTSNNTLTYTGSSTINTTAATEMVALVAPTNLDGTITIKLTIDKTLYSTTLPVSSVSAWVGANEYTYYITVNNEEIIIDNVNITDWTTITEIDISI